MSHSLLYHRKYSRTLGRTLHTPCPFLASGSLQNNGLGSEPRDRRQFGHRRWQDAQTLRLASGVRRQTFLGRDALDERRRLPLQEGCGEVRNKCAALHWGTLACAEADRVNARMHGALDAIGGLPRLLERFAAFTPRRFALKPQSIICMRWLPSPHKVMF